LSSRFPREFQVAETGRCLALWRLRLCKFLRKSGGAWVLNLSDGEYSLQDIAERSNLGISILKDAVNALCSVKLLKKL